MTIGRDDLEAKLLEIQAVIEETTQGVKNTGVMVAVGVAVLVLLVFLGGRRRGRRSAARLEVYKLR
jgi:uncharacterized protein (TIGR03382 family)